MQVILTPASGEIHVKDSLRFESPTTEWTFKLNKGLQHNLDATIADDSHPWITTYRLNTDKPVESLEMKFRGKLTLFKSQPSDMPLGFLDDSGAYLDGSVAWYPASDLPISRFNIRTQRHVNWEVISAGARQTDEQSIIWSSQVPHDDLYLLAGDYTLYQRQHKTLSLQVWLLASDPELAEIYLSQSAESIDEYSELIGPYPFAKFAVIENRWQTGFGMPSFTLLGSRVMRLPFIPKSSLPHEIAHNWLGNGIWVDHALGNWSEGLTAYLADHRMKAKTGSDLGHRLKSLQRYTNFAAEQNDQPLTSFKSRHDDRSQALGYDKSLMLFHMLHTAMGEDAFNAGLKRLWTTHRYQRVGFSRVLNTLLSEHPELRQHAEQWINQARASKLNVEKIDHADSSLSVTLKQSGSAQPLYVPYEWIDTNGKRHRDAIMMQDALYTIEINDQVKQLHIDPDYDVLRYLDPREQPPAFNQLFSQATTLVIPTAASADEQKAWVGFAQTLKQRYPLLQAQIDIEPLDPHLPAILLGWNNQYLENRLNDFQRSDQQLSQRALRIDQQTYPERNTLALMGQGIGFIAASSAEAIEDLGYKLPHYGSFGRVVFDKSLNSLRRDHLQAERSPLKLQFD